MAGKRFSRLRERAGYTVVEAMTVVGAMGVVAAFSAPSIMNFKSKQEVQAATSQVAGMLQQVRARAAGEAIPHLVLFQQEDVVDGERSAFALIVRDNDRNYSLTPPDDVETFALDPALRPEVRQFGEAPTAPIYETMVAPVEDQSPNATGLVGGLLTGLLGGGSGSSGSGSGSSGSGSSGSGSSGGGLLGGLLGGGSGSGSSGSGSSGSSSSGSAIPREQVRDAVTNGTSFSVSSADGVPAIAFNERGIPVSPDSPQEWGTGAGAVYLTDNENAVYAAVLSPLGEVSVRQYDAATSTWRK